MKFFIAATFAAIFCFSFALATDTNETTGPTEEWEHNPLLTNPNRTTDPLVLRQLRALRQNVRDTGCDVNLGFVLQGDDFIDDQDWEDQKNFVDLLVAILTTDSPGNYVAAQYGLTSYTIQTFTKNKELFLRRVRKARRTGGLETNIAAALGYAGFPMIARKDDANTLIVLGDGLESIGFGPRRVAKALLRRGVDVLAVAVGGFSIDALTEMVGGDANKVFEINGFFELAEVVYGLVVDVCGLPPF